MDNFELIIYPLILGYLLDLLLGDPRNIPHPIVGFGNIITWCDKRFNKSANQLLNGTVCALALTIGTYVIFAFAWQWLKGINHIAYILLSAIFVFYGLANKSLLQEGREVFKYLNEKGIDAGRKRLSWIVGRDTNNLSTQEIRLAVFETLSENLSDGVVAPLFYYALGGIPAMMCYKMINTMDSMWGYRNDKYLFFGRVAARLDDIANYIPARLTALMMALVGLSWRSVIFIFRYGKAHISPNSGYPEAAMAGILDCRFGGPHNYGGVNVDKPYIGANDRPIQNSEIKKISRINHSVCLLSIVLISLLYYLCINPSFDLFYNI